MFGIVVPTRRDHPPQVIFSQKYSRTSRGAHKTTARQLLIDMLCREIEVLPDSHMTILYLVRGIVYFK